MRTAIAERQSVEEEHRRRSNQMPYRQVAYLFAGLYCVVLALTAAVIKMIKRVIPDTVHRKLAAIYYYVPEMALHKSIELDALLRHRYQGRGMDLGCGAGQVGGVLIELAGLEDLHGVDYNETCRESTVANGYTSFTHCDIQALAHPDETFDYAVSICVIEHVPDLPRALAEIRRVLKPGGRFVFTTPAPLFRESTLGYQFLSLCGLRGRAEAFKACKDVRSMQFHYLSPEGWRRALEEAGFDTPVVSGIFSRRQLLVYDLLNIQVNWMQFYYADKLLMMLTTHARLKRIMIAVTGVLSAYFGRQSEPIGLDSATHYVIDCVRRRRPRRQDGTMAALEGDGL